MFLITPNYTLNLLLQFLWEAVRFASWHNNWDLSWAISSVSMALLFSLRFQGIWLNGTKNLGFANIRLRKNRQVKYIKRAISQTQIDFWPSAGGLDLHCIENSPILWMISRLGLSYSSQPEKRNRSGGWGRKCLTFSHFNIQTAWEAL